jgi:hypothetical protein
MDIRFAAGLAFALGLAGTAAAQSAPASIPSTSAPPVQHKAAIDTVIDIEIAQPISTRSLKQGDMFAIRLASPIKAGGEVIVPAGIIGQGQVVDTGKAGLMGKPAKLVLAARYLDWNGRRIPLHAFRWWEGAGEDRTDTVMVASMVPYAGVLSIFIHGGEIDVPVGARATAKLGAEVSAPPAEPAAQ